MSENISTKKPTAKIKTAGVSVQIYKKGKKTIVTTGITGGKGKGNPGGRFGGKKTV